ncbi:MAG: hypothetical protein RPU61_14510 [Candidatus Sedimenticola sp. (ex Thyasira tokunagai)]
MSRYRIDIDFKDGCSFGCDLPASNKAIAKTKGIREARLCGFSAPVKKVSASLIQEAA